MTDSPVLDQKDRPGGVIEPGALCIGFLQDGLDYWHHRFPWAGALTSTQLVVSGPYIQLPEDFILDMRDGLVIKVTDGGPGRLMRRDVQQIVTIRAEGQSGVPRIYAVADPVISVAPAPNKPYTAWLYYYKLPLVLGPGDKPNFPSDWCLIEYVRLRCEEWVRAQPPGTAMAYAERECTKLLKTGLGREPESTTLRLDPATFGISTQNRWSWMG